MTNDVGYEDALHRTLWLWADKHHRDELDGGPRLKRPPKSSVLHLPVVAFFVVSATAWTRARFQSSADGLTVAAEPACAG